MANIKKLTQDAKKVIDTIQYIDLATVTKEGTPWSSPLWFVRDNKYNFYFYSPKYSQHSKNVKENGKGFVVIYDSKAPKGAGFGVYMTAKVKELNKTTDINNAIKLIFKKKKKQRTPQDFLGKSPRRIYKITPIKVWVNDAELKNGLYLDYRIPIKL
jgi:general stress protein 26